MNYHIAICDDAAADLNYVSALVNEWTKHSQNIVHIEVFPSSETFLFHYEDNKEFDILLLDIEMGSMNGVALAKKIREENNSIQIIFITGYPDFIAEGYDVSALHYLIKPASKEKVFEVLDRAVFNLAKIEESVMFTVNGEARRILTKDIIYTEAFAHACVINTKKGNFEIRLGISDVEKLLHEGFVRCHRSYIVGVRYINSISKTDIELDNGAKIPLSRSNYKDVNQAFIRRFRGE